MATPDPMGIAQRSSAGTYREDINGLRAIAVIGVVLFHYDSPILQGGYAGVDVFFVISGFLMSKIILHRLETDRFDVLAFYKARAKRIVPALVALSAVLLVTGAWILDPTTYAAIGRAVASSLLFVSNIQYYNEVGYFDAGSATKWLLHSWSLSIEWQFYIVYPLLLAIIWRWRRSRFVLAGAVATVGVGSFALCLAATTYRPSGAFFLLPMRAWEMAAGGVVAIAVADPPRFALWTRLLQLAGLAAIAVAMFAFDGMTPWPSYRALLPVAGTCLVILADRRHSRLTGNLVLRPIGAWSYAIYIWHWPLAVGCRYFELKLSFAAKLGLLTAVMVGGGAAYVLLARSFELRRRRGLAPLATTFTLMLTAAVAVVWSRGFEERRPTMRPLFAQLRAASTDWAFPEGCGHLSRRGEFTPCSIAGAEPGKVLFIGDSEMQAIFGRWGPKRDGARGDHATLTFLTYGGCPALPDVNRREAGYSCPTFFEAALAAAESGSYRRVVLTSLWSSYFARGTETVCFRYPRECPVEDVDGLRRAMAEAVQRLQPHIAKMKAAGTEVVILFTIPYSRYDIPIELTKRLFLDWPTADVAAINRAAFLRGDEIVREPLRRLAASTGASIVDPLPYLCNAEACPTGDEETASFYRDSVHIRTTVMRSARFRFLDALARLDRQDGRSDAHGQ